MNLHHVSHTRLQHQHISKAIFDSPKELVAHLGAMQAQDYEMAKWGIALRLKNFTEKDVEESINNASIIRSHVLRPTWHFVASGDYRWMLDVSAPQLKRNAKTYNRQVGLDDDDLKKSYTIISKLLRNNHHLTREEIMEALKKSNINTNEYRSLHIMFHAEINGLVCNGVRKGKQQTYALLDERVPASKALSREEGLAKLALNYFTSHAPATVHDFSWWSGLNLGDARKAVDLTKSALNTIEIDNKAFYFTQSDLKKSKHKEQIHLLPAFDEFLVSYADRTASLDSKITRDAITVNGIFKPVIVIDGRVAGLWKRTIKPKHIEIELFPFEKMNKEMKEKIQQRFRPYSSYLNDVALKFL